MFITAALVIAVFMLAAEKHSTTPFAPVRFLPSICLALWLTAADIGWHRVDAIRRASVRQFLIQERETYLPVSVSQFSILARA